MDYNATLELDSRSGPELVDRLAGFAAAAAPTDTGRLAVTITLTATSVRQACQLARALVDDAIRHMPSSTDPDLSNPDPSNGAATGAGEDLVMLLEVLPTVEYDARLGMAGLQGCSVSARPPPSSGSANKGCPAAARQRHPGRSQGRPGLACAAGKRSRRPRPGSRPERGSDAARPAAGPTTSTVATRVELETQRDRALALGATQLLDRTDDEDEPTYVFADPAGHPFCVFVSDE